MRFSSGNEFQHAISSNSKSFAFLQSFTGLFICSLISLSSSQAYGKGVPGTIKEI